MKTFCGLILLTLAPLCDCAEAGQLIPPSAGRTFEEFKKHIPVKGLIPDEKTAASVGEAILRAYFRRTWSEAEEPVVADLSDEYWIVSSRDGIHAVILSRRDGTIMLISGVQ